jgi:hypothetical protein
METFGAAKGAGAGTRSGVFGPKTQTANRPLGAFAGLMIRPGTPENAVFGAG